MNKQKSDLSNVYIKARELVSQGRIDNALGLYAEILKVDSYNALAYADRGTVYAMLKKFDMALSDLEQAFAFGYIDASAYSTVATIYFELKQFPNALKYFAKAIELNPTYPFTYYNRSSVFHELGDERAAIADLEKCLTFNSEDDFKRLVLHRIDLLKYHKPTT